MVRWKLGEENYLQLMEYARAEPAARWQAKDPSGNAGTSSGSRLVIPSVSWDVASNDRK